MDTLLLFATRGLRMFSFGSVGVVFAVYLHELGFSDQRIGVLLTLTLLGDSVISLAITIFADRVGKWRMQLLGCMLLLMAGLLFACPWSQTFWLLTTAATIGVVSPSGNEVGPFQVRKEHLCTGRICERLPDFVFAGLGAVYACRAHCAYS
jgi:MFS family permease